ncbi:MAG TPA: glycosyltransferase family 2 protein [Ferrovibrio sp.]|uniref:glycosyltransferase family 2 protein n=1 Tax=Ferrovibrio sp. TaxID=1917215 RepID=UPI002ED3ADCB
MSSSQPFVSIVTPVYNGARFLKECIESALQQSYGDFEHVILDNASTDGSREIAEQYAAADRRIRVVSNPATLPMVENWNRAMEQISERSTYCKVLHADDLIYPDCLSKMVDLAVRNPSIGMVGSLRLRGTFVECEGLPKERSVFPGAEVARLYLRQDVFGFAPTSGLIRADLVRGTRPFYPPRYLHSDLANYLDLLDRVDYGFVHEVLCFSRIHEDSMTTLVTSQRQTLMREWLLMLQEYGPRYFGPEELARLERDHLRRCYRLLVRGLVTGRGRDFLQYHLAGLRAAQRAPSIATLGRAMVAEFGAAIAHPKKALRHVEAALAGGSIRSAAQSSRNGPP